MSKITCNVIRDLLPLYVDDALSEDTKTLVKEHLAFCKSCQKEFAEMQAPVELPGFEKAQVQDMEMIRGLRKKMMRKRVGIVCLSVLLTTVLLLGGFYLLLIRGFPVTYDQVEITDEIRGEEESVSQRTWILSARNKSGKPIAIKGGNGYYPRTKLLYTTIDGQQVECGQEFHLYEPLTSSWAGPDTFRIGWMCPEGVELPDDFDYTFRVVFKDQTVEYSAREAGFFAQ